MSMVLRLLGRIRIISYYFLKVLGYFSYSSVANCMRCQQVIMDDYCIHIKMKNEGVFTIDGVDF